MASIIKYPGTVSQTTGGKYVSFSDLNNIKNAASGAYAVSSVLIKGKKSTPNRPSTVTCTNFQFNIPVGAEPTKVTVELAHRKYNGSTTGKSCNIGAPTLSLVGVSGISSIKGIAPIIGFGDKRSKTFNVAGKLTRAQVNSGSFGVKINYPTNTNSYDGYMAIGYVRISLEYKVSSYTVQLRKVSGGYNGEDYTVEAMISNRNLTDYNPSLTLSSPTGFSFKEVKGNGTVIQNSVSSFTWNPKLSKKVGTSSINFVFTPNITFPTGTTSYEGTFTLSESLNSSSANHVAVIVPLPEPVAEDSPVKEFDEEVSDEDGSEEDVIITYNVPVYSSDYDNMSPAEDEGPWINISSLTDLGSETTGSKRRVTINSNGNIKYWGGTTSPGWNSISAGTPYVREASTASGALGVSWEFWLSSVIPQTVNLNIKVESNPMVYDAEQETYVSAGWSTVSETTMIIIFKVPKETVEEYDTPYLAILELTQEELDRLGNETPYVLQAHLKQNTTNTQIIDNYRNNRVLVFNNPILDNITVTEEEINGETVETITDSTDYDNLSVDDLFWNAEYISPQLTSVNSYNSLECEFTYNQNYPFYIIYSGEFAEMEEDYDLDKGTITFTEPSIIEKNVYHGREPTGNYPVPINGLLDSTGELSIESLNNASTLVFNDLPLGEDYGNNDNLSIRGIELIGQVEQATDELVVYAKLINPEGITGQRTVIIEQSDIIDNENIIRLGGLGDLWGFQQTELENLEDFEIELTISNMLNEATNTINFGSFNLIIYVEQLEKQLIEVYVEGENLSHYGAFLNDITRPEGLETDTEFLNIDGTDTNDAYRQNVKEKTIELEFSIDGCDMNTSSLMLRQITKLLVNRRDEYNRPIPKQIWFSDYPDVYFEYVIEKALDITNTNGNYDVKAKLTIPSGTSYSKANTTTNIIGYVQGLVSINPVITLKPLNDTITITELNTNQRFTIGYSGGWQSKIVMIDCANRKVWLLESDDDTTGLDISKYVDFNSDWFRLYGEYSFESSDCTIRTVTFKERW